MASAERLVKQIDGAIQSLSAMRQYLVSKSSSPLPARLDKIEDAGFKHARAAFNDQVPTLRRMVLGPHEALRDHFALTVVPISTHFIHKFNIPEKVPIDGSISYAELSQQTGFGEKHLQRMLGHASVYGIFEETAERRVRHTAMSRVLAEDVGLRSFCNTYFQHIWGAAAAAVESDERFPNSQSPYESGFGVLRGQQQSFYDVLQADPAAAKSFVAGLQSFGQSEGYEIADVVDHYPWAALPPAATIVDVGGAAGYVSIAIAQKHPDLKFIVQDVMELPRPAGLPPSVAARLTFAKHDFFTPQPVAGADLYLFRMVFHNQGDADGARILQALIPALKPGARVLLVDGELPAPSDLVPAFDEVRVRNMDQVMMAAFNALQRDADAWRALFAAADPRFHYLGSVKRDGCASWFIEAEWRP